MIRAWWKKWPDANVGVATGAGSGIVVLDFDGSDGVSTLQKLAVDDPSIHQTLIHQTGSGGWHFFFRHPGVIIPTTARRLPGMDVRGEGGLIILPPSRHEFGRYYTVFNDDPILNLPSSLQPLLQECHKERLGETKNDQEQPSVTMQGGTEGTDVSRTLRGVDKDRIESAIRQSLPLSSGIRNRQVFALARHLLAIEGVTQQIPATEFKQIIERWHRMATAQATRLGFKIAGDVEETWTDFRYAWGRVKHPFGEELRPVFDRVANMDSGGEVEPLVHNALMYYRRTEDPLMRILVGVLFELAQCAGDEPFSLACNAGAHQFQRLGFKQVDSKWILRRLQTLAGDEILTCIDRGKAGSRGIGKVALYRWIWQMKPAPSTEYE